jgi:hypothetical protein
VDNQKLLNVMNGIKSDLIKGYQSYGANAKDTNIRAAIGKLDVLLELLKK